MRGPIDWLQKEISSMSAPGGSWNLLQRELRLIVRLYINYRGTDRGKAGEEKIYFNQKFIVHIHCGVGDGEKFIRAERLWERRGKAKLRLSLFNKLTLICSIKNTTFACLASSLDNSLQIKRISINEGFMGRAVENGEA
jgi:hypothetical protein